MTLQRGRQVTHLIVGLDAGGAEHALLRLAEAQIAQGWNVNIIYLKASAYGLKDAFESLNISVFHISTLPKIADKLRALHENRGQHVIHSHLFYADSLGWMLKGLLNLPWVTTLHSTFDFHTRNSSRRAISKKLYPRADAVFAVSHEVSLSFEAECPRMNLHVIPNPVSKRFFEAPLGRATQTGIKKLLLIGRLAPEKRCDWGIQALSYLPDNYHLTIAGEGPLAHLLREEAASLKLMNRVHFVGLQHNPVSFFHEADLVLLPSAHEGLPLVALEAIATQTPILAQSVGGLTSLLADSPFPAKNMNTPQIFANEIKTMLEAPAKLTAWKQWSQKERNAFAVKTIALKYIHHYQAVLDSHSQRT